MNIFITGGAGFIGCNLADSHLKRGDHVVVFDNLSRKGTDANLKWLQDNYGDQLVFIRGDIRNYDHIISALETNTDLIYHMAGQVAVTTSVVDPREDFEINALGTFNVLEAARHTAPKAVFFYASTNKVYGGMEASSLTEDETRYRYLNFPLGISEQQPLDFHSPYGCSKGSGDQYVRDYARIYGLRTVVMRQSCIYGTRQLGVEDQGWIAYFCIAAHQNRKITIYGNGKQVRDVLWVDDLIRAYDLAYKKIDIAAGQIYNIGGGPDNTISIWKEFGPLLDGLVGNDVQFEHADWRPGDQQVYISDIRKAGDELGWTPEVSVQAGVEHLWDWITSTPELFG